MGLIFSSSAQAAWAASTLDAVPVAVDSGNPWESPAPAASSSGDQEGEDNWANFAKFDSMATTATATPMEVSDAVPSPAGNVNPFHWHQDLPDFQRIFFFFLTLTAMEDMSPPAEAKETESAPEGYGFARDPSCGTSISNVTAFLSPFPKQV